MRGTSQQRPYQGYPYVNPPVHDAPSMDPAAAARWNHLPRKQVALPIQRTEPTSSPPLREQDGGSSAAVPWKSVPDPSPVVYIDMPEAGGSYVSQSSTEQVTELNSGTDRRKSKEPVVYIEIPDNTGSEVATTPQHEDTTMEPEYVQDTIFFSPFENRRMEMHKEDRIQSDSDEESSSTSHIPGRWMPHSRPDLHGASSSGVCSSSAAAGSSSLSGLMSKETMLYGHDSNGFPMSPIPVSEFPEPPPAYTEIDRVTSPAVSATEAVVEQPRPGDGPRTQVILPLGPVPPTPIGQPSPERKLVSCQHCGMRVHTLVVREYGLITHITAVVCFIVCMLPCVAFIYCTDAFKIRNHYCPTCNKIIGYQLPFGSDNLVYVN